MAYLKGTFINRAETQNTEAEAATINSLSEQADENLPMSPGDKLCEDELTIIFSNYWISTKDLINFRLVNKSWRDAATTTLLQRDACYVTLYIKTVKAGAGNEVRSCCWSPGGENETLKTPQFLSELMSNSPKFPASNFQIQACHRHLTDYANCADLVLFFKLHGEKVKSLRPLCSSISQQILLSICFIYAPKLEFLDLGRAERILVSQSNQDNVERIPSKWTSKIFPFKSIMFGHCGNHKSQAYQAFMDLLLLSSQSNLNRIDVTLSRTSKFWNPFNLARAKTEKIFCQ